MPWVPVKHALRKLREARGWSLQELADESGVSTRSLTRIEAPADEGVIYRVTRAVSKRLPLYATVFAPDAETAKTLMQAYRSGEHVVMLTRVVYDPYQASWRGFFWIEEEMKSKKFAFVVT